MCICTRCTCASARVAPPQTRATPKTIRAAFFIIHFSPIRSQSRFTRMNADQICVHPRKSVLEDFDCPSVISLAKLLCVLFEVGAQGDYLLEIGAGFFRLVNIHGVTRLENGIVYETH